MIAGFIVENRLGGGLLLPPRAAPARVCCTVGVLALQTMCVQPFWSSTEMAAQTAQSSGGGSSTRIRVNLDGFDLSHTGRSPNQVGTGSHESPEPMPESAAPAPRPPLVNSLGSHLGRSQVGGASRPLPSTKLYAPASAKAYSLTPTFYWSAEDPKSTYTFTVITVGLGRKQIYSTSITGGRYTYPSTAPALEPGGVYVWSVGLTSAEPGSAAEGKFTIVGGPERAALAEKIAAAGGSGLAAQAGIMFEGRVWFDALDDYTRLIEQGPTPEFYRQRSALYDQVPVTYPLADADMAKASQ